MRGIEDQRIPTCFSKAKTIPCSANPNSYIVYMADMKEDALMESDEIIMKEQKSSQSNEESLIIVTTDYILTGCKQQMETDELMNEILTMSPLEKRKLLACIKACKAIVA